MGLQPGPLSLLEVHLHWKLFRKRAHSSEMSEPPTSLYGPALIGSVPLPGGEAKDTQWAVGTGHNFSEDPSGLFF